MIFHKSRHWYLDVYFDAFPSNLFEKEETKAFLWFEKDIRIADILRR